MCSTRMNTEFKPLKIQFQIHRNLSDFTKPRYTANLHGCVVVDGRTMDEVRNRASKLVYNALPSVGTEFLVMAE